MLGIEASALVALAMIVSLVAQAMIIGGMVSLTLII
jgi:hypothetical protein